MNENIDLTKILKDCPKETKLYSTVFGEVEFEYIHNGSDSIAYKTKTGRKFDVNSNGRMFSDYDGECTLFPSKNQRDWSKFSAPWYKKDKFDPKTLKPFDRVLTRHFDDERWDINFYSYKKLSWPYPYICIDGAYKYCMPYNDDTKHLVGTTDEAPEYYRYWES